MPLLSSEITVKELFLSACEANDWQKVQLIFSLGGDVNWRRDADGWSGLHLAARDNYGELLELLLAQTGVDVNIRTNYNSTPQMWACVEGHENIVRRLCQVTGIQLNCREDGGWTALHYAVDLNRQACVSVLREVAGVDWNVRSNAGLYPLTLAVERGHADILQIILTVPEPYLDLSVTDWRGRNIAQIAVEENRGDRQKCVELLSGDGRVDHLWNVENPDGDTPLMYCIKYKATSLVTTLLANPSQDLDTVDSDGLHLEDVARLLNRTDVLSVLATFTTVRKRMILRGKDFKDITLQILARDALLLRLIDTNQERLVSAVVAKLGGTDITKAGRKALQADVFSYLV